MSIALRFKQNLLFSGTIDFLVNQQEQKWFVIRFVLVWCFQILWFRIYISVDSSLTRLIQETKKWRMSGRIWMFLQLARACRGQECWNFCRMSLAKCILFKAQAFRIWGKIYQKCDQKEGVVFGFNFDGFWLVFDLQKEDLRHQKPHQKWMKI